MEKDKDMKEENKPKVIVDINPEKSRRKDIDQMRMYEESYDSFLNRRWKLLCLLSSIVTFHSIQNGMCFY